MATTTSLPTAASSAISLTTSSAPVPTETHKSSGLSVSTSPVLFFVALGFGIVFVNLWVIVGVKYCFRRKRRIRERMLAAERGEVYEPFDEIGYDLGLARPTYRRRREKKVLSIEDVDERFPIQKYKLWRADREHAGLSTNGGVASHITSRAASVDLDRDGATKEEVEYLETVDTTASGSATAAVDSSSDAPSQRNSINTSTYTTTKPPLDEEDEDDAVLTHPNLHPDLADTSGDACAICLEQLADEDSIRALSCGHAFHASCIEPWLTTRRACCPLCKADYYVPKEGDLAMVPLPTSPDYARLRASYYTPYGIGSLLDPHGTLLHHGLSFSGGQPLRVNEYSSASLGIPETGESTTHQSQSWASRFVRARLSRSRSVADTLPTTESQAPEART